ncbi:hypothetical protein RB196_28730 [Streptomyces sp. PmtA]|uniref:hypothetical protein n=1 Tax=Streptomyces sp. PmtA TaxID=3074275 RepID=UPI0030153EE3
MNRLNSPGSTRNGCPERSSAIPGSSANVSSRAPRATAPAFLVSTALTGPVRQWAGAPTTSAPIRSIGSDEMFLSPVQAIQ